jgi:hypothetical protein
MESFLPDLSKIPKAERFEAGVVIHIWLYGIKVLPRHL